MGKRTRPLAPSVETSSAAASPRRTPAAARRSQASRVRSAVRTQLAQSQRRRQELSHALVVLRRDLREFRNQVRTRLREMSQEVALRRAPCLKTLALPAAVAPAPVEPIAAVADPPPVLPPPVPTATAGSAFTPQESR